MLAHYCPAQFAQAKATKQGVITAKEVKACLHYAFPVAHSYLTCCEYCRGEMHEVLTSPVGDDTMYVPQDVSPGSF